MSKLHEKVMNRLHHQLGEGFKVIDIRHHDDDSSVLTVEGPNGQQEAIIPKAIINDRINGTVVIPVAEGETYEQLFNKLSELNDLYWVPEVDFPIEVETITFSEDGSSVRFTYTVPETSYLWKGTVDIEAILVKPDENSSLLVVDTNPVRIAMALSSNIFQIDDELFTEGNKAVTAKFAKTIITHIKSKGLGGITAADIGGGEIVELVTDGFSGMAVVRPKRGPVLFIRFRSKSPKPRTK